VFPTREDEELNYSTRGVLASKIPEPVKLQSTVEQITFPFFDLRATLPSF